MAWLVVAKYDGMQPLFMKAIDGCIQFRPDPKEAVKLVERRDAEDVARCWVGCEPYEFK